MIIRAPLRLRHGRIALPKSSPLHHHPSTRRFNSSLETDTPTSSVVGVPTFIDTTSSLPATSRPDSLPAVPINDPNHPVALDYAFFQHQKSALAGTGSVLSPHYKPYQLLSNPPYPRDITLELLIASQSHLGHATSLWNPANSRYIFGVRDGVHIISPDVTASHLRRACKIVSGVTERGGLVLFVGTREGHARAVVKAAGMAKGCHLFTKWIPGSITNGQQILGGCAKKVVNELDQEVEGFEAQLGSKAALKPDLVVCLNPLENYILLHECGLNKIPTIGIIDTDANPTWVTYPIPANDDSLRCVQVVAGVLGRAGQEGQEARARLARRGIVSYSATHGLEPPARPEKPRSRQPSRRQQHLDAPITAAAEESSTLDEPNFDADLVGVSVAQHEEDQRLLDQAEQTLFESDGGAEFADPSSPLSSSIEETAASTSASPSPSLLPDDENEEELERGNHLHTNPDEDLNSLDSSLRTDETSPPSSTSPSSSSTEGMAEEEYDPTEDFAQFGSQIEAERERIAFQTKQQDGGKDGDVMEQVEGVVEELGEGEELDGQGQMQGEGKGEGDVQSEVKTVEEGEEDPAVDRTRLEEEPVVDAKEEPVVAKEEGEKKRE
ncbi:unnamed protein product [Zymoseptoria tritici ST99CH_1E4]|uniref:Ribosomal protein S2 n=1 Tax=Zymoseptoria tritici ST99CH_1E4 TaxID=1276532 RepID=A0A2H1H376_ZYMTR|nr:unnamed protein product [Zymoseptoria tritici ST99CH_1E4]